jgi:hypothetical protein
MRQELDFSFRNQGGAIYLRFVNDKPGFMMLHNLSNRRVLVSEITLHIDFMRAELYPQDIGHDARGLGLVGFGGGYGPHIISRRVTQDRQESYGFVFDIASPYPMPELEPPLVVRSHVLGSTMRNARIAFGEAYQQYLQWVKRDTTFGGVPAPHEPSYQVPVYDVVDWRNRTDDKDGFGKFAGTTYLPTFKLVGMVRHIDTPLTQAARAKFAAEQKGLPERHLDGVPDEASPIVPNAKEDVIPKRRPTLRRFGETSDDTAA